MKYFLLFIFCQLVFSFGICQKKDSFFLIESSKIQDIDSLDKEIIKNNLKMFHSSKNDTLKLRYLSNIVQNTSEIFLWINYNKEITYYCNKILKKRNSVLVKKTIQKFYADAIYDIGYCYLLNNDLQKALRYTKKSLMLYQQNKSDIGKSNALNNLAVILNSQGNCQIAIKYNFEVLKIKEKLQDYKGIALTLSNIGVMYDQQDDFENAFIYYKKGLLFEIKNKNKAGIATAYDNLAYIYKKKKQNKKALYYMRESLKINKEINNQSGISSSLDNFGSYYFDLKEYQKALSYFQSSLKIDLEDGNLSGIAGNNFSIGNCYFYLGNYVESKARAEKSIILAKEIGYPKIIEASSNLLMLIYKKEKNWNKAFEMKELYHKMHDSIKNLDHQKENFKLGIKYEYEKKKEIEKRENEKKIAISNEKEKEQKIISFFTLGILVIVILFFIILFKKFKLSEIQKKIIENQKIAVENQKHLVEEKHKEITDSITYAKRIQSAILPQEKLIKEYFPNSFILYKPKDIVAGDFYWFEVIDDLIFFAAADCTGHGVPGALVSVVCHNSLNRSVKEFNLKKPSDILDKTREIVISEFEKSDEDVKDGMDISLFVIDLKSKLMNWSGAHNPLWILRNQDVIEFKADKQPIGKFAYAKLFTNHEIQLEATDEIYISTDGFQDQFGGEKGKKFKANQLKEILILNSQKTMNEKLNLLDQTFEKWKGDLKQVDDVCVIGVRL